MKPLSPARMVLLKAADFLNERGLAKGTQCDSEGMVCVHGALSFVATGQFRSDPRTHDESVGLLVIYLRSTGVSEELARSDGCAFWNNRPERTKEEVVFALRAAAVHGMDR